MWLLIRLSSKIAKLRSYLCCTRNTGMGLRLTRIGFDSVQPKRKR